MLRSERTMHGGKLGGRAEQQRQAPRAAPPHNETTSPQSAAAEKEEKNWVSIEDAAAWAIHDQHCLCVVRLQ